MADTNAGAIRNVIVEIKYISSDNVAMHLENWKFHWIVLRKNSRKPYVRESSRMRGFMDFTFEVFYIDFVEPGNPGKAQFVLRTQDRQDHLEMFKKSDCKSLSVRDMQRVVTFEKHSVNIVLQKSPPEGLLCIRTKNKDICSGTGNGICGKNGLGAGTGAKFGLGNGIWTPPPPH